MLQGLETVLLDRKPHGIEGDRAAGRQHAPLKHVIEAQRSASLAAFESVTDQRQALPGRQGADHQRGRRLGLLERQHAHAAMLLHGRARFFVGRGAASGGWGRKADCGRRPPAIGQPPPAAQAFGNVEHPHAAQRHIMSGLVGHLRQEHDRRTIAVEANAAFQHDSLAPAPADFCSASQHVAAGRGFGLGRLGPEQVPTHLDREAVAPQGGGGRSAPGGIPAAAGLV